VGQPVSTACGCGVWISESVPPAGAGGFLSSSPATALFDNSTKNRWNPDATKTVRWDQQTWEEMMIGFIGFTFDKQTLPTS